MLQQAAELAGVSCVPAGDVRRVPSQRDESGVIAVGRRDVKRLPQQPKAETGRRTVLQRPDVER